MTGELAARPTSGCNQRETNQPRPIEYQMCSTWNHQHPMKKKQEGLQEIVKQVPAAKKRLKAAQHNLAKVNKVIVCAMNKVNVSCVQWKRNVANELGNIKSISTVWTERKKHMATAAAVHHHRNRPHLLLLVPNRARFLPPLLPAHPNVKVKVKRKMVLQVVRRTRRTRRWHNMRGNGCAKKDMRINMV